MKDLAASRAFYDKLGFKQIAGESRSLVKPADARSRCSSAVRVMKAKDGVTLLAREQAGEGTRIMDPLSASVLLELNEEVDEEKAAAMQDAVSRR